MYACRQVGQGHTGVRTAYGGVFHLVLLHMQFPPPHRNPARAVFMLAYVRSDSWTQAFRRDCARSCLCVAYKDCAGTGGVKKLTCMRLMWSGPLTSIDARPSALLNGALFSLYTAIAASVNAGCQRMMDGCGEAGGVACQRMVALSC